MQRIRNIIQLLSVDKVNIQINLLNLLYIQRGRNPSPLTDV